MKPKIGLWVDHRKALVLILREKEEEFFTLESQVETQPRRTGDHPMEGSFEAHQVPGDDQQQKALSGNLAIYYDRIIARIRDAQEVFIFGPSEAKGELKKRLELRSLGQLLSPMETTDKMTDNQVKEKVRDHFRTGQH